MRWTKIGKIFDPTRFSLPNGCVEFAQSPQTLIFDDFIRIYFSTRALDNSGKYLSHIAFVDFDKNFREAIRVSAEEVIPLGGLGCFDEHGIFPINPIRHEKDIFAYTCGWSRRVSVSVETAIGLAVSQDHGETFQRIGPGPILTASLNEPFLVGDGFVKILDGVFHMWYIFGTTWDVLEKGKPADRTYKIGHATSLNGIDWSREEGRQIIPDRLGPQESQALPSVIEFQGRYTMAFCYRHSSDFRTNKRRGYRIGFAHSDDLKNWERDDTSFPGEGAEGEWDSDMQCYPHLFQYNKKTYMLYNGNEFGRYGFGLAVLEP